MTSELEAKLAGRRVVASISGGKDSGAMSLLLKELGIDHDRFFLDTGCEARWTYHYVLPRPDARVAILAVEMNEDGTPWTEDQADQFLDRQDAELGEAPLQKAIGPIVVLRAEKQMQENIIAHGMFPSRTKRFCTEDLKVRPAQKYMNALVEAGADCVNAVGIRRAESEARSKMEEWEWSEGFDCEVWRPLIHWTENQVILIHQRHGLRPNPLYLKGATRVGCWPCIYARKSEIRAIAEIDPGRIGRIRKLEGEVTDAAAAQYAARGEVLPWRRGFFQAKLRVIQNGEKLWPPVPIDEVVAWSKTSRGGAPVSADRFSQPRRGVHALGSVRDEGQRHGRRVGGA